VTARLTQPTPQPLEGQQTIDDTQDDDNRERTGEEAYAAAPVAVTEPAALPNGAPSSTRRSGDSAKW
jgi:hypothetical protein